jgi:hypothetical protein
MTDGNSAMKHKRRHLFGLAALAAGLLASAKQASASRMMSKASVGYRDVPSADGKVCVQCIYYIPIKAGQPLGTCRLVAGEINPGGWCEIWAPRA